MSNNNNLICHKCGYDNLNKTVLPSNIDDLMCMFEYEDGGSVFDPIPVSISKTEITCSKCSYTFKTN